MSSSTNKTLRETLIRGLQDKPDAEPGSRPRGTDSNKVISLIQAAAVLGLGRKGRASNPRKNTEHIVTRLAGHRFVVAGEDHARQ